MAEVVARIGVKKAKGFLYFLDKHGDVSRAKMARAGQRGGHPEKIAKAGVKRAQGYLYFIDKHGNVARAKMARGGRRKKHR